MGERLYVFAQGAVLGWWRDRPASDLNIGLLCPELVFSLPPVPGLV